MDWNTILTSIVTSGIISGAIGIYATDRAKRKEFSYDYKKYILDRRKEAYLKAEELVSFGVYDRSENLSDLSFDENNAHARFLAFRKRLAEIHKNSIWLSPRLIDSMSDLGELIIEIISSVKKPDEEWTTALFKARAQELIKNERKIRDAEYLVRQAYFADVKELDDIEKFLGERQLV
jgi:hypothetical protein